MTRYKLTQSLLLATLVIALALGWSALPGRARAQGSDPAALVTAFNEATSGATNVDAALALVTEDVTIRIVPPPPANPSGTWTGKEGARAFVQFAAAQNPRRQLVGAWQVNGDKVSGTIKISNNDLTKWGVGAVEHSLEAVVQGSKLKSVTFTMSPAEQPRVAAARVAAAATPATLPATGGNGGIEANWMLAFGVVLLSGLGLILMRIARRV